MGFPRCISSRRTPEFCFQLALGLPWSGKRSSNDVEGGSLERAGVTQGRPKSLGHSTLWSDKAWTPPLDPPRSAASRPRDEAVEIRSGSTPAQRSGRRRRIHAGLPEGHGLLWSGGFAPPLSRVTAERKARRARIPQVQGEVEVYQEG